MLQRWLLCLDILVDQGRSLPVSRHLGVLLRKRARSKTAAPEKVYDIYPGLTRHDGNEPEPGMDPDLGDERGRNSGGSGKI
jgi:hypothetical protein